MDDSNVAEVFSRPNTSARIHDFENFTLWADTPDRPGYRARLAFGERNGSPRISVFTNIEGAPVVWIGFDPLTFNVFLKKFEAIVNGENGGADKIDNMGAPPGAERGKAVKEHDLVVRNVLHFGKSQEGVCWVAVEQTGVKNIRFMILPTMWHHFYGTDGQPMTPKTASVAFAQSLIECLRSAMAKFTSRIRPMSEKAAARAAEGGAPIGSGSVTTFGDDVTFQ